MKSIPTFRIETEDKDITDYYSNINRGWKDSSLLETVIYELLLNEKVIGYVTASMKSLSETLDDVEYFVHPALLLGRMGIDINFRKQGFGPKLVKFILGLAIKLKDEIGCRFVILEVDKNRERLVNFYSDLGFEKAEYQPKEKKKELYVMYFDLNSLNL